MSSLLIKGIILINSQPAQDVRTTLLQRYFNVSASFQRPCNVVLTSYAGWDLRVDQFTLRFTHFIHIFQSQERRSREEKQAKFEKTRLQSEIEKQEAKLTRLKKIRKSTDARFDSLRKKNDYYRDMNEHVKDLNTGRKRAEILP